MTQSPNEPSSADPERRAAIVGVAAAPALVLFAGVVGMVEGGLLPGACQGLACLFTGIVLGAAGVIIVVWFVVWLGIRVTRRRWPHARWRLWAVRILAAVSWAPLVWLSIVALE